MGWGCCSFGRDVKSDEEIRLDMYHCFAKYKRKLFPSVEDVKSKDIVDMKNDSYVLVDCRGKEERAVSRLPGSISKADFDSNIQLYKDKLIIASW